MSKLKTTFKAAGYVSGITPTISLVKSTGDAVGRSLDHIGNAWATAWKLARKPPAKLPAVPASMTAENQFWTYMQRFGKGQEHLPILRQQTQSAAYMSALGAVCFVGTLLLFPLGSGLLFDAARLVVPVALFAVTAKHAYANWLYRREAHGSFRDFIHSGDWIPRR
ncbi:hypothetical protein [uncultured Nitratireductor sp.]|uniref:hypothetical protein n=1 Tax=uncultured Nitratireductor sp. TaxID=520953 RepID=UPI0025D92540|nr:hypothetical protein [uncultured Nitratireductor sp.]